MTIRTRTRTKQREVCDYCQKSTRVSALKAVWVDCSFHVRGACTCTRHLCQVCELRVERRRCEWQDANTAPVAVLSLAAAAIVRAKWSEKAVRELFRFDVREPEQLPLVVRRTVRESAGYARVDGEHGPRYVERWTTFCGVEIPFSLLPDTRTQEGHRAVELSTRFFGGFRQVAKAAGVLANAKSGPR